MWWVGAASAWELEGPDAAPTGRVVTASSVFVPGPVPPGSTAHSEALGEVARECARELREQRDLGSPLGTAGLFGELGVDVERVLSTLDLVTTVAAQDRGLPHPRLEDPAWLASHFDAFTWVPDRAAAAARKITVDHRIRLTSYAVFEAKGSPTQAPGRDTALWALPDDEADGVPGYRTRFTRMEVFGGVYGAAGLAAGHARPLVWLSRADANQALLQGSVVVLLEGDDGAVTRHTYNVHENNGIAWDPAQKDPNRQARFWYFREVAGLLGVEQIPLQPLATVAGDVYDLGLCKLVALSWEEGGVPRLQLAVLADTGGAFEPNLFQLDWLAGTFSTMAAYQSWAAAAPSRVVASVLLARAGVAP